MSTTETKQYRVSAPMIQIQGHVPFMGRHGALDRHLRLGDVVPEWVPVDEVDRLLANGCIEEVPS